MKKKKRILSALVLIVMKVRKNIQSMYRQNAVKINISLKGEEGKKHFFIIKDLNTFMYDNTLPRWRKHFCTYCLQAFRAEEKLKYHIKDWFNIDVKQKIKIPKEDESIRFKNYQGKIKSPFMI